MSDLSPATEAVLDAMSKELDYAPIRHLQQAGAAALRAAADHVEWPADVSLRIIASELEGTND